MQINFMHIFLLLPICTFLFDYLIKSVDVIRFVFRPAYKKINNFLKKLRVEERFVKIKLKCQSLLFTPDSGP